MYSKMKIWLSPPHLEGTEEKYVKQAFQTNWIAPAGINIEKFEEELQQYLGKESYVSVLNSGTAAIHLGLLLLGVKENDEVICQSMTFVASANPIVYLKAIPIFVDSEINTWNMCPVLLEKAIKDRILKGKKPKVIIAVHLYGMPYKVDEIHAIGKKYNIPILEDSAEALGSIYKNKKCGTFGDIAAFSFNGNKIITTSGGGALVSKQLSDKEKTLFLSTQAKDKASHYQHSEIGYNYRMSNVLAGIGRGQLEVINDRVNSRRNNYEMYFKSLSKYKEISFIEQPKEMYSNRWLSCVLTPNFNFREKLRLSLKKNSIETRPLWKPLHLQPLFSSFPSYTNGVSENLFSRGLCLPSGSNLSLQELNYIISIIINNIND